MKTAKLFIILCVLATFFVCGIALALEAPTLIVTVSGTTLSLSWTTVAGASGYTLYYAPYPKADWIGNIPMEDMTSMSTSLQHGSAFYVAVKAYDDAESSEYSNIDYFVIEGYPLLSVNPSSLKVKTGETGTCSVGGGTGNYDVASSDSSVAEAAISGSTLYVLGGKQGSAVVTIYDSEPSVTPVSITVNTNGFLFPFKISNWNVNEGDNRWGDDGCAIYSDLVLKTTDDGDYYTGFGAYTAPAPYYTRMVIRIFPYYEWVGHRILNSGAFDGFSNFKVDDGVMYFYKYLDTSYPENVDALLNAMASGQTLGYTFHTDLKYYPTIHEDISLDGFATAKKAFEYCIQLHPN